MATKVPADFRSFAMLHPDAEAVIQRCGLNTWDCVVIAVDGRWTRAVFLTKELAEEACRDLAIRAHEGWEDPRLSRRQNREDAWRTPDGDRRAV